MGKWNKAGWCLAGCLLAVLLFIAVSIFVPGRLTDAVKWLADNEFTSRMRATPGQETERGYSLIEMKVEGIMSSPIDSQPVIILKEKAGESYLPIWVGLLEANAISVVLNGIEVPRPLSPDLFVSTVDRVGASINYIIINDFRGNIFYARVALRAGWRRMEIDARPSDAIAIALRVEAPIYVNKAVLDEVGFKKDEKSEGRPTF